MERNRDPSFDAFRGIAIIAVIVMHAMYYGGADCNIGVIYFYQLINFAVPVFFFISGYWASRKIIASWGDYKAFLTKRFSRILLPYLFWSFILLGYSALRSRDFNGGRILFALITGGACIGYYFVIVLAQLYVITPVLQFINSRLKVYGLVLVVIFYVVILSALYLSRVFGVIGHIPHILPFYSWVVYYEIGMFAGNSRRDLPQGQKTLIYTLLGAIFFFVLAAAEAGLVFEKYNNFYFAIFPIKYFSFLYSSCIILIFLLTKACFEQMPAIMNKIGRYSFGIYFIHMIFLGQVVLLMQKLNISYTFKPMYLAALSAITLTLCLLLIGSARKLLPDCFCVKVLGF